MLRAAVWAFDRVDALWTGARRPALGLDGGGKGVGVLLAHPPPPLLRGVRLPGRAGRLGGGPAAGAADALERVRGARHLRPARLLLPRPAPPDAPRRRPGE